MPKLWDETVELHRIAVRDAILEAGWKLATEHGVLSVTMTQIAQEAGIGRATLYKYFPDVESVLRANHQRHVEAHLAELTQHTTGPGSATERLEALLRSYARICHLRGRRGSADVSALLHRQREVAEAEQRVRTLLAQALDEAAASGGVRSQMPTAELADYCLHALGAAVKAPDAAALTRLVDLVMRSLGPGSSCPRDP